jgi:signal recognition particle GTPase
MIPGMPAGMMDGNEEDTAAKLKRMIFITDAMRQDELDSDGMIFVSRVLQWRDRIELAKQLSPSSLFRALGYSLHLHG